MQTISINFIVLQGWHELSDKQLRYVYQLLAQNFTSDEVKTLCLLHWTDTKVIGQQSTDGYLLRKGKFIFEVTPLIIVDNLYQGYLQTQDDAVHDDRAKVVYPDIKTPLKADERISIFYWVASLKDYFARRYTDYIRQIH